MTSPCSFASQDHPRRCGENCIGLDTSNFVIGSPPQVRGKHNIQSENSICAGITPAGAGKTERQSKRPRPPEDHPRRCGENALITGIADDAPGSPPQVRGKHPALSRRTFPTRITPAGAGKTSSPVTSVNPPQDHPRRCGENPLSALSNHLQIGSPPQVRGKLKIYRKCS